MICVLSCKVTKIFEKSLANFSPAKSARRIAQIVLDKLAEGGEVGEAEIHGDLLDGAVREAQGLRDGVQGVLVDPRQGRLAAGLLNNLEYVVDSLVIEDAGALVALIYPDWPLATQKGMDKAALEAHLTSLLPAINRELPNYSHLKKFEFMPEDFERTPKRSIKRYIYQRK